MMLASVILSLLPRYNDCNLVQWIDTEMMLSSGSFIKDSIIWVLLYITDCNEGLEGRMHYRFVFWDVHEWNGDETKDYEISWRL
jgi:hypothetical protein